MKKLHKNNEFLHNMHEEMNVRIEKLHLQIRIKLKSMSQSDLTANYFFNLTSFILTFSNFIKSCFSLSFHFKCDQVLVLSCLLCNTIQILFTSFLQFLWTIYIRFYLKWNQCCHYDCKPFAFVICDKLWISLSKDLNVHPIC